jgi:hypothetical protein
VVNTVKKWTTLTVTVFLVLTLAGPVQAATPKAGAKCTKAGATATAAGKKFTCVKSGNKLAWNKGVTVKAAAKPELNPVFKPVEPTPVATPSATPTPTPTPTPAPTIKYPDAPTSFDDLIANYAGISYAAWNKSSAVIASSNDVALPFKAITGVNTTLSFKNPASAFDLVSRMYPGYKSASDMTVLTFSYDDRDWAQAQMKQLQPKSTWQWITDTACSTRPTCDGGGVFTDDKGSGLIVLTTGVARGGQDPGALEAHEFTHAIQQNLLRRASVWPLTTDWPPTWFIEGQALFTQNATTYHQSFDLYTKNRRSSSQDLYRDSAITSAWIQEFFVVNQSQDWFNKYPRWRQYDLGAMFVETLASIKGPTATMEIWKVMGTGLKFSEAFEKVYGISYEKALPVISKAIALQLGRS